MALCSGRRRQAEMARRQAGRQAGPAPTSPSQRPRCVTVQDTVSDDNTLTLT